MNELLLAIQSAILEGSTEFEEQSVCIVRHENYLPPEAKSPAVGIKDGLIKRRELAGGAVEYDMTVILAVWCQIIDGSQRDASITGNGGDIDGVLALAANIVSLLDCNLLGITGMSRAFAVECRASEPMGINTTTLQRKIIVMNYVKETEGTCGS